MMNRICLGTAKTNIKESQSYNPEKDSLSILGENIYITKHSWDCKWYWGFGYIGNRNLHCHANIFIKQLLWHGINDVFDTSIFKTDTDFWVFKDLLIQAYALQKCAEVYRNGGHCTTYKGVTDTIQNSKTETLINNDVEKVLNKLWDFLEKFEVIKHI